MIGDPHAVEPLIATLHDPYRGIRSSAARALGQIGDPRAVVPLIAARGDGYRYVRLYAIRSVGQITDARSVSHLIEALRDMETLLHKWEPVCDIAAEALLRIGTPDALAAVETWRKEHPRDEKS